MKNSSRTPDRKIPNTSKTPNKRRNSKSKSPSSSTISINKQTNHTYCREHKFSSELDLIFKELGNSNNKLSACLQIYSILDSSMQSQRCLQHNNTLSLYCINQRRILCVNCLYGMHKHRSHKVVPLKDSMEMVYEDNQQLAFYVEEQIKKLDHFNKIMQENSLLLETEMHKALNQLEKQYKRKMEEVRAEYEQQRTQIENNINPLLHKSNDVRIKLDDFRYKVYDTFTKYEGSNRGFLNEDKQIMKQLLFVNMLQLCQIRCRVITKHQLQHLVRKGRKGWKN